MKKQIGLLIIGLLILTSGFSQTGDNLYQEIDSIVNSIKTISNSCIRTKTHEGSNGQDSWFREIFQTTDNKIILLTLNNKDIYGLQLVEYFYSNNQLIFVKQTHIDIKENITIEQFYVYYGDLIRWIGPNGEYKDENSESFKKVSLELADFANELVSDFKKQ